MAESKEKELINAANEGKGPNHLKSGINADRDHLLGNESAQISVVEYGSYFRDDIIRRCQSQVVASTNEHKDSHLNK